MNRRKAGIIFIIIALLAAVIFLIVSSSPNKEATSQTNPTSSSEPAVRTAPDGYAVYKDKDLGFSFIHPVAWGTVSKQYNNSTGQPQYTYQIGPVNMLALHADAEHGAGDSPLPPLSQGYEKIGDDYMLRALTDMAASEQGSGVSNIVMPYNADSDYFRALSNGALISGYECADADALGCGLTGTINLTKNRDYPGMGFTYSRLLTEADKETGAPATYKPFQESIDEFQEFLQSIEVKI